MAIIPSKKDPFLKWQLADYSADFLQMGNGAGTILSWFDGSGVLHNNNISSPPNAASNDGIPGPVILGSLGGQPTISHGVPVEVASYVSGPATQAALSGVTLYNIPVDFGGFFRATWIAHITQVASSSSILGGTNGLQITYVDDNGQTLLGGTTGFAGSVYNTLQTVLSGTIAMYAASNSAMTFAFGYSSTGTTPMQYRLRIRLEDL